MTASALVATVIRNERRVRLVFSGALAAGAFATTPYTVAGQDGAGTDPSVKAALAVSGDPNAVELVLGADLALGGLYLLTLTAVPFTVLASFTGTQLFRTAGTTDATNAEPETDDLDELLYGVDLVHDGTDYVEDASGDLASIAGIPNVKGALERRLKGDPLPWDGQYGAQSNEFVDAPIPSAPTLRGSLVAQARADDRVLTVTADLTANDDTTATFTIDLTLIGGGPPISVTQQVTPTK